MQVLVRAWLASVPALSILLWMPVVAMLIIAVVPASRGRLLRTLALTGTASTLAWSIFITVGFDASLATLQLVERRPWAPEMGMSYALGVDGLALPLVLLTTLMGFVAMLVAVRQRDQAKIFFAWLLVLEFAVLGVFLSQDWFLFYVFWEITLIPMFFLIGMWGGEKRVLASVTFFLYTFAGSIVMLVSMLAVHVYLPSHSFDMVADLAARDTWDAAFQTKIFAGFLLGFAVKLPIVPLHGWLPLAHVEAPTPASMFLSAVLLKMGAYGIMRSGQMLPLGLEALAPVLSIFAVVNIGYGAVLAWRRTDLKAMVAFSSVSHMGIVILGIAALNERGFVGASMTMLTHGLTSGALFLLVGAIYERTHSRQLEDLVGIGARVPVYAGFMALALLANMGMPGFAGFIAELNAMLGALARFGAWALCATFGVLITAAYCLRNIGRMFFSKGYKGADVTDLSRSETIGAAILVGLCLVIGIVPSPLLGVIRPTVQAMLPAIEQDGLR